MATDTKAKQAPEPDDDDLDLRAQVSALEAQMQALLQVQSRGGGITEDVLERMLLKVAQISAQASQRAVNPSNPDHLHIGHYTYPEGDLLRPRVLKCQMFWVGYDISTDTTSAKEVELLNRAEPGVYRFTRSDGTPDTLTVTGEYAPDGKTLSKLNFLFQSREQRESLPSQADMLRQAFGVQTDEQMRIAALEAQLQALGANVLTA